MRSRFSALALASLVVTRMGVVPLAAQNPPAPPATAAGVSIPLRVQLVISRFQGEKKVSAVPFAFVMTATEVSSRNEELSRIRMGAEMPFAAPTSSDAKPAAANAASGPAMKAFGTNIDCFAKILDNGRFKLTLTVEDSSPYSDEERAKIAAGANPVVRSFRMSNVLVLRDGQSEQFATATDKFTGEVVKMDVTLSVVK